MEHHCPQPDPRRCVCGFSSRTIGCLFLSLIEATYTVTEERVVRRILPESEPDGPSGQGSA